MPKTIANVGLAELEWHPQGRVCQKCGTPNPDGGLRCGNCDGMVAGKLKRLLTPEQFAVHRSIKESQTTRRSKS